MHDDFPQRINAETHTHSIPSYLINLDPAVTHTPYEANIDIRDTVNYKRVMKDYQLGPNGAILTSLNLFATNFHQVPCAIRSPALALVSACPSSLRLLLIRCWTSLIAEHRI